jgi:hypothetical protein
MLYHLITGKTHQNYYVIRNGKFVPVQAMKARGRANAYLCSFLTLQIEVDLQIHTPTAPPYVFMACKRVTLAI